MDMDLSIQGLQEAQRDNLRAIRAVEPGHAIGDGVRVAGTEMHRYVVIITHVDTASLRTAHFMEYSEMWGNAQVKIEIDPSARNPRSGTPPAIYGTYEHARGGQHAFYERALVEHADAAADMGLTAMMRWLP